MKRSSGLMVATLVLGFLVVVPSQAFAFTYRAGESVTVGESVNDDLYLFGTTVEVSGDVDGDVIAFGQTIRVTGNVTGDVISAGQNVTISGEVDGSVRAAGSDVIVDGAVGEDLVAAGNNVRVSSEGTVERDVVAAGSRVMLEGDVGRDVIAGTERLEISASVGGDVTADVQRLVVTSDGSVEGDVSYYSDRRAQVDGRIAGEENRYPARHRRAFDERPEPSPFASAFWAFFGWVRGLVGMAIFALLVLAAFRPFTERAAWEAWYGRPLLAAALGFGFFIATLPIAGFVFLIGLLVGGWWIAFVWLALVWLLTLVGAVAAALAIGNWLVRVIAHRTVHPMLAALLGVFVLSLVGAVPFIGWLAYFIAMLVGMGAVVLTMWAPARPTTPEVAAPVGPPPAV